MLTREKTIRFLATVVLLVAWGGRGVCADAPPVVVAVEPDGLVEAEGKAVAIYGVNLYGPLTVEFGEGNPATSASTNPNGNTSNVGVPPGSGTVDIIVTSGDKKGILENAFTYLPTPPPTITSVSPVAGLPIDVGLVTITGTDFDPGNRSVFFGDKKSGWLSYGSTTEFRAEVPLDAGPGTVDVTVVNGDGQSGVLKGGFTVLPPPPPIITNVEPKASVPGGVIVTITGENFAWPTTIEFGEDNHATFIWYSGSKRYAGVPAGVVGTVDLIITNGTDGQKFVLEQGFTVLPLPPPIIMNVEPKAVVPGGVLVTITGENFAWPTTIEFGEDNHATFISYSGSTKRYAAVPAGVVGTVDLIITNGTDGQKFVLEQGFTILPFPPPIITNVEPKAAVPGEVVAITGENFGWPMTIEFGEDNPATIISRSGSTWRSAAVPTGVVGTVDLIITNEADGQKFVLEQGFTILPLPPPIIMNVEPKAAMPGELLVTMTGENFTWPTRMIEFGEGNLSPFFSYGGTTQRYAAVPEGVVGTVDLIITNDTDGQKFVLEQGFTILPFPPPIVTSVQPSAGRGGTGTVTISGENFEGGATVEFGAGNVVSGTWGSGTSLYAPNPTGTGTVDVIVTNPTDGQSFTYEQGYTFLPVPPPIVTSVDPNAATPGSMVYVYGENFQPGATVEFGEDNFSPNVQGSGSTYRHVEVPQGAGTVDVIVRNLDQQQGILKDGFAFGDVPPQPGPTPAPTIVSVVPDTGSSPLGVSINGTGFHHEATVEFGLENSSPYVSFRTTELLYVVVPDAFGVVDVIVTNLDEQSATLTDGFTYAPKPAPTITSVVPDTGSPVLGVNIYGTDFHHEADVEFGSENLSQYVSFRTSGHLYAVVPDGSGVVNVIVTNPDEQSATLTDGFTYAPKPAPTIDSVVPDTGSPVLGVNIYGTNFHYETTVEFGTDNLSQHVGFRTSEHLYVVVPEGSGVVDVIVTNPDEQSATLTDGFTYAPKPPPTIDSVVPDTGRPVFGVNIYGTNFHYEATVEFGTDNPSENVSFRTSEHLYVVVPEGSGVVDVIVTNPYGGGSATLANGFTYQPLPPPVIDSVIPDTGSPVLGVNIYGTNFHYETTVEFGTDNLSQHVGFRTSEHLYAVVPEGSGVVDVIVTNPDEQSATLTDGFTYAPKPPPTINSVIPDAGRPVFGVNIYGTNFHHEATVEFGTDNPSQHVSFRTSEHLYVVVPEGEGTVDVIVTNPYGGGSATLPNGFTYQPPPPPVIDQVVPDQGSPVLGVHIYGSNYKPGTTVEFGAGSAAIYVSFRTSDHLFVVVPYGEGTVDVIVTNPDDGGSATLEDGFTYVVDP